MTPSPLPAALFALGATAALASAAITPYAEYHLGETGANANNLPVDTSGNGRDFVNSINGGNATIGNAGFHPQAAYSTAYLDTGGSGNEGWYSTGLFTSLPGDHFAFGVFARAAANTSTTQGDVFTLGGLNGAFKLSLAKNGWAASAHNVAWIGGGDGVAGSFAADTWVHLALIRSGGITTFYINGVAQGTTYSGAPVHNTPHLSVSPGGSTFFDGRIDEARVVTFDAGAATADILTALMTPATPPAPEPVIVTQPASALVSAGSNASFSVGVTNTHGTATSNPATLTLLAAPAPATVPSATQQAQIDRRYGMFCHFGVNTFVNQEWTDGSVPATAFAPTAVDADQWVQTAKAAGMRYLLLTTKHHDGFCLWDSQWTTYDVASSSVPQIDVVKRVAEACARHGIRFAIYYLPYEATVTLSAGSHWFFNTGDTQTKSPATLEHAFNVATAQNNLLVFNAAPNRDGVLLPSNVTALTQLAHRLGLEPDRPHPVNLALAATVTASSTWAAAGYEAPKACDENPDTRWSAAAGDLSPSLEIDFGSPTRFDRVIVNEYGENNSYRCTAFVLESGDGETWTTVHTGTTLGESIRIDLATPVTDRKLRLRVTTLTNPVSLWNLKVQDSARPNPAHRTPAKTNIAFLFAKVKDHE